MIQVSNAPCVRRLGYRAMAASRSRNMIAVLAIALTTMLFTSLFTIVMSLNSGIQQSNFRQVGGYAHGGFKYLTKEQFLELREDPLIREWGARRFLGMATEKPFNKSHVELSCTDANQSRWMFCDPVEGRLPKEGTDEAATDTRILELLGVKPELGAKFSVTFDVDGHETTQKFTLCGWWEYDNAIIANHIFMPESRVDKILSQLGVGIPGNDGMTGTWNLDVMFSGPAHIEENMRTILDRHGYQADDRHEDNYLPIGVNWGYSASQLAENIGLETVAAILTVVCLIIVTGYLIIYNVFQISVTNDIRFYGLLKTIGTTGKQIRRIVRQQAFLLCLIGIPAGLLLGWSAGAWLVPAVTERMAGIDHIVSMSPFIFVGAAIFSLFTVLLSCARPGRMASRVSPIEAVRYAEGGAVGTKSSRRRKGQSGTVPAKYSSGDRLSKKMKKEGNLDGMDGGVSVFSMAWANLGRSRSRTVITVLSLTLAVVLFYMTFVFSRGFDMDKYLADNSICDFILASDRYFQVGHGFKGAEDALPETAVMDIREAGDIAAGGRIYGKTGWVQEFITEEYYRATFGTWQDPNYLDDIIAAMERNEDGQLGQMVQISGMEGFILDQLTVLDGDISKLYEPGTRYVGVVQNPVTMECPAQVGDTVTLRYVEEYEFYNPFTGEVYENPNSIRDDDPFRRRARRYRDVEYEAAVVVTVPTTLSYRYFGADEFVMNDQTFIQDTGTDSVMLYACNAAEGAVEDIETFLDEYTHRVNASLDYESKATIQAEFHDMLSMFLMLGGSLSFIVGLVGVLNFFNAILTGMLTRRREFAVLQSIGMTGGQLKRMLVYEGLLYGAGAVVCSAVLATAVGPVLGKMVESMFWFFVYKLDLRPILAMVPVFGVLGCGLPLIVYHYVARKTVVERLREMV